jgi:hypothetical protein
VSKCVQKICQCIIGHATNDNSCRYDDDHFPRTLIFLWREIFSACHCIIIYGTVPIKANQIFVRLSH